MVRYKERWSLVDEVQAPAPHLPTCVTFDEQLDPLSPFVQVQIGMMIITIIFCLPDS